MSGSNSHAEKGKGANEVLEVEDDEQRQAHMHELLSKLNHSSTSTRTFLPTDKPFDFGDRKTFAVEPPAELLSRVQAFLPDLVASNADLERRAQDDPSSIDIENVEGAEAYIQMNLGLGVFEQRRRSASSSSSHSESEDNSAESDSESGTDEGSSDTSDSDSSSSSEATDALPIPRPIKPLPRRSARPEILVLPNHDSTNNG